MNLKTNPLSDYHRNVLQTGHWVVITATREAAGPHYAPENMAANVMLRDALRDFGFTFVEVTGCYKGVDQGESCVVYCQSAPEDLRALDGFLNSMLRLARLFGQETILHRLGLIPSSETNPLGWVNRVLWDTYLGKAKALELRFDEATPAGDYTQFPSGLRFAIV